MNKTDEYLKKKIDSFTKAYKGEDPKEILSDMRGKNLITDTMTQEQKAKAYDKAIERAKITLDCCNSASIATKNTVYGIFPELKESEDEKIRKHIISVPEDAWQTCKNIDYDSSRIQEDIAWLGKQSKENMIEALRLEYEKGKADALQEQRKEWTSEDLLNRNEIMDILQEYNRDDLIDWLEKQGETFDENIITRDDEILQAISVGLTDMKEDFGWSDFGGLPIEEIQDWLEKQGEKTVIGNGSNSVSVSDGNTSVTSKEVVSYPTVIDSDGGKCTTASTTFKPKFKIGDFIVNDYCMGRVVELTNDAYLLDTEQGIPFSYEHNVHLWTIKDAEDGDVLCCESGWTCIFKALNSAISFSSYCFMDNTGWFCGTGSESHTLEKAFIKAYNGNIYPATKEQCDLLFQKMKEAGYEWDAEKKELKLLITNGSDFCQENCKGFQETGKCFADGECDVKKSQRMVSAEAKEALYDNAEDFEEELTNIIFTNTATLELPIKRLMGLCHTIYKDVLEAARKELEKNPTNSGKPAWSEYDEKCLNGIIDEIEANKSEGPDYDIPTYDRFLDWLKSLKDRVCPKQEWSEENKNIICTIQNIICASSLIETTEEKCKLLDWLKSFKDREQPQWKPTKEQMNALDSTLQYSQVSNNSYESLNSLYNDLKKLIIE